MLSRIIVTATLTSLAALGQTFEVASIKPAKPGNRERGIVTNPGGRLDAKASTLKALVQFAYNVRPPQLAGGPNWFDVDRYDIAAKADGAAKPDQLRLMLQTLLADRFKLKVHRETKEMPVYALVAGRNEPKLRQVEAGNGPLLTGAGRGQVTCERVSMQVFTRFLSQQVGRTVLDRTNLKGNFDFTLKWVPEERQSMAESPEVVNHADGPSIFTAVQEQLNLKLEATKGPVEIITVDHAEKPSEN
jgi:uncharacterized protein (TIGR03435 family)